MKRAAVWLAVVLSPIALAAQSGGVSFGVASSTSGNGSQPTVLTMQPQAAGCPVSLRAQHKADGSMVQVGNVHPRGMGQQLHLVLTDKQSILTSNPVVQATVTVHGYSNKARVTQTGGGNQADDAVRTVTVRFSTLPNHTVAGDLWAPGMTAVTWIDLDSVTYADGSMTSFTGQQACRVAPDPLMLLAVR